MTHRDGFPRFSARSAWRGDVVHRKPRAIELSTEKYCSATAMLEKTAEITHDFEIVEAG